MNRTEAIEFYKSEKWKEMNSRQICELQLYERRLCMPFSIFHEAVQKELGRPVYTHEFGSLGSKRLVAEFECRIGARQ